ncbi:nSTAND1 domain-containing NTPase [Streptomyces fulvoviolaceus]|uniref:nSTAND1 domain-containing NTPase n=1 Tax=Streptomyces fulvoviolaceus TaxID=285535 RepID=UPI0021BE02C6|nr:DNA-binding protein [Streptomyces fulvoviolaceus]MCT9084477.1 DNA-binding protein [Streptomyces fulvoviolaceus]
MSPAEASQPGGEEMRFEAHASDRARVYQAGRDQHVAERDLHLHYEDGVRCARRAVPGTPAGECPYPGLAAFDEGQARWFFGRDAVTADLLVRLDDRLREGGALALVAPSGAGKSSLLRAGLLPALARGALPAPGSENWPRLLLVPGAHPVATLAAHLAEATGVSPQAVAEAVAAGPQACVAMVRAAASDDDPATRRLVVVVDQLEELFTLCTSERERHAFLDVLTALAHAEREDAGPAGLVVYGLRSDFYTPCAGHAQLRTVLQHGQLVVGPMTRTELREAILFPARAADLDIEPGLVELLLRDLGTHDADGAASTAPQGYDAGRLPLLAHALRATWQQRHGHTLTVDGYQATGGIRHAVATTAERLFTSLAPAAQHTARTLFLRLVKIGDGVDDARRRLLHADLLDAGKDPEATTAVIDAYTRGRLLTRHQDTVEITHEALLHAWPELRNWIDVDRAGHLIHQDLEEDATDWDRADRDPGMLYRGPRLEAARAWADRPHQDQLSPTATIFLDASTSHARRAARLRRSVIAILAALALIASGAAVAAFQQRNSAQAQRDTAISRQLAAQSENLTTDPAVSALLAAAAWRISRTPEARAALTGVLGRPYRGSLTGYTESADSMAFSPDGRTLATGNSSGEETDGVQLWDMKTRRPLGAPFTKGVDAVAFSPDGKTLTTGGSDGSRGAVWFWDAATGRPLGKPLTGDISTVYAVAFSHDGKTLATTGRGDDGVVQLWDTATRRPLGKPLIGPTESVDSVAFSRDGRTLATSSGDDGVVQLWDTATRRPLGKPLTKGFSSVAFNLEGDTLAAIGLLEGEGSMGLWDVDTRRPIGKPFTFTADVGGSASSLAFSPDGQTLAGDGGDGKVRLWDVATRRPLGEPLTGPSPGVYEVAFNRDGLLATGGYPRFGRVLDTVQFWDVSTRRPLGRPLSGPKEPVGAVDFSPDGRTFATSSLGVEDSSGRVRFWDAATRRPLGKPLTTPSGGAYEVVFSPDGKTLATSSGDDAVVQLWDVATRRPLGDPLAKGFISMVFSPDSKTLVTVGDGGAGLDGYDGGEGVVRLWDVKTRRPLGSPLTGPSGEVFEVVLNRDGKTLAAVSDDGNGTVWLWDMTHHQQVGKRLTTGGALAFSPDGRTLAVSSGHDEYTVLLWDVATRRQLGTPLEHTGPVFSLAFSPDSRTLATADAGLVRLWDAATRRQLGEPLSARFGEPLGARFGQVSTVEYSRDGRTLATISFGTLQLWDVFVPKDLIGTVCDVARRSLTRDEWDRYVPPGPRFRKLCP